MGKRVLIGDDDPDIAWLLDTALTELGYQTRVEPTGADALAAAREWKPDLAILDVMMPKMDGFAVCRELKRDAEGSAVRVLIVTSKAYEADRRLAIEAGADDYLVKPFDLNVVIAKVAELTNRP